MGLRNPLTDDEKNKALALFRLIANAQTGVAAEIGLQGAMRCTKAELRRLLAGLESCIEQEPGTLMWRTNDHPVHAPIRFEMLFGYSIEVEYQKRRIARYKRAIEGADVIEDTVADSLWLNDEPPPGVDRSKLILARWLLIEEARLGGEWFITAHESPYHAREYHDNQDAIDDWLVVKLIDLDTGRELVASTRTITEFVAP